MLPLSGLPIAASVKSDSRLAFVVVSNPFETTGDDLAVVAARGQLLNCPDLFAADILLTRQPTRTPAESSAAVVPRVETQIVKIDEARQR
jgi:hypothetical protein